MKRSTGVRRIASSRICVPSTFVVTNSERALLDRLLDVRLGGGVDDHVDLGDDLGDEVGVADVAVHERQALVRHDLREVAGLPAYVSASSDTTSYGSREAGGG